MSTNKKNKLTPMMEQYMKIKAKNPNHILFYRLGDFYETFFDDARIVSEVLGITLTSRGKHLDTPIPLAGFPHLHLDNYLYKLIRAGYKTVVCDQIENPKYAKGVVKRDIIEIVSPGTALSENLIDRTTNNYIASVIYENNIYGFSAADVTTGEFLASQTESFLEFIETILLFSPSEILIPNNSLLLKQKEFSSLKLNLTLLEEWKFDYDFTSDSLYDFIPKENIVKSELKNDTIALKCAGNITYYVKENLRADLKHFSELKKYKRSEFVEIDENTRRNLELLNPINSNGNKEATLYFVLNKTNTGMGARLLKHWICSPLKSLKEINERLDFVSYFNKNHIQSKKISTLLKVINDIERFAGKIIALKINPIEILKLKDSLKLIPEIKKELNASSDETVTKISNQLKDIPKLIEYIEKSIFEDAPINVNEGGFIKEGFNKELDDYLYIVNQSKTLLLDLQTKVRAELNIPNLKVGYNRVFGYYFEVTRKYEDKIPSSYTKKQTLVNQMRFINEELKVYEEKILNADEKIKEIEKDLLFIIRKELINYIEIIKTNSTVLGKIDCLNSFAEVAFQRNYNRPILNSKYDIEIKQGRHPVVESLLPPGEDFIPNDLKFNRKEQILIITGPNMSGKSTYLRQTALIVLMSQMGCFVPADFAKIGMTDKIFTRVGASDNLAGGESTFLVEMNESASILNNATPKSLIIFDEVGRGTSTFDGLSIAWAIVEYIHNTKSLMSRTLFATHYHEMTEISKICNRVKNYSVKVKEYNDEVIFMRKIIEGGSDNSYGIYVAKLAGLPSGIINRANEILSNLEKNELTPDNKPKIAAGESVGIRLEQMSLFSSDNDILRQKIQDIDINKITPIEALNQLNELKKII